MTLANNDDNYFKPAGHPYELARTLAHEGDGNWRLFDDESTVWDRYLAYWHLFYLADANHPIGSPFHRHGFLVRVDGILQGEVVFLAIRRRLEVRVKVRPSSRDGKIFDVAHNFRALSIGYGKQPIH